MTNLATEVARLKRELAQVKKGQRLSHGASVENAAIEVRDDSGSLRAIVGQQGDGTTGAVIVNGPPPPQPSLPIVASVLGGVTASWDGLFAGGAVMPLDWSRIEVHASTAAVFTPDSVTLQSTIETAQGATVVIPCETNIYVCLVARSTSGTASTPSGIVGPFGPAPVVAGDLLDGIVTTVKLADDAVTQAKVAVGAIGTTEISDNAVTTPKIVAGAVQTAQIDAEAVNASKIATGAVTTLKLDALAVTADKLATNSVTASKILAGSVSAQALTIGVAQSIVTKLTDTMADASVWARVGESGTYATVTGVNDSVAGSTVMQVTGPASLERAENIPYDATALYRVTVRLRTTTAPTSGLPRMYLGLAGIAADGVTRVSIGGVDTINSQHYVAANALTINAGPSWTTVTGYIQGTASTGTTTACPDPRTPGKANSNVRYVRPLMRLLFGATGGVVQVDQVTVETVPTGVVNSVNIVDGAVTADALSANSVTTDKLAAGSVDATALKADAITGKTITGGTVTGATVQTAPSGARVVLDTAMRLYNPDGELLAEAVPDGTALGYPDDAGFVVYNTVGIGRYWAQLSRGFIRFGKDGVNFRWAPLIDYFISGTNNSTVKIGSGALESGGEEENQATISLIGTSGTATNDHPRVDIGGSGIRDSGRADLNVTGILAVGNHAYGQTTVTPSAAHTPTSATVVYNVTGTTFFGQATANTTVPGVRTPVGAAGVTGVGVSGATATSMLVWVNRENTTATNVNWEVWSS